jgi:hypothetical protein
MKNYRITLALDGLDSEGGYIRLNDFIAELGRFVEIARQAEDVVSNKTSRSIYYRIVDLKHSSPASITLEARAKDPKFDIRAAILDEIADTMTKLKSGEEIKGRERFYLIESIKNFADPIGKNISRLNVFFDQNKINLDQEFKARANLYVAPEESCKASFRGMLDIINIHGPEKLFWLYPEIGPHKIQCTFPERLFETAKMALGKRVEIVGLFNYKINAPYPHAAEVDDMSTLPPDAELPNFKDLLGIDPDFTSGLSSEDYIRKIRNED